MLNKPNACTNLHSRKVNYPNMSNHCKGYHCNFPQTYWHKCIFFVLASEEHMLSSSSKQWQEIYKCRLYTIIICKCIYAKSEISISIQASTIRKCVKMPYTPMKQLKKLKKQHSSFSYWIFWLKNKLMQADLFCITTQLTFQHCE